MFQKTIDIVNVSHFKKHHNVAKATNRVLWGKIVNFIIKGRGNKMCSHIR